MGLQSAGQRSKKITEDVLTKGPETGHCEPRGGKKMSGSPKACFTSLAMTLFYFSHGIIK
jgi:hypothetical protein